MSGATDTIAAIATPPGKGGVGIVRVSGPDAIRIAQSVLGIEPEARRAHFCAFSDTIEQQRQVIDRGIALFFPGPNSFTGEDVLELQGHGGPVIMDWLLQATVRAGARLARPGEFSERAFLNNKIDLAQAEAIADLIDSASQQAARQALRSLDGEFSQRIHDLVESTTILRMYVESAIDFPEEEIDFIGDGKVANDLDNLIEQVHSVFQSARQGSLLREGITVVIAGKPNAGKSSLLNALAGRESAIVTDIAGTTRDVLRENILIDGMPLHIVDTAGLRDSDDPVESEGIRRAWTEIDKADRVLLVVDSQEDWQEEGDLASALPASLERLAQMPNLTVIHNKCDLSGKQPGISTSALTEIALSAKQGNGIDLLRQHLKDCVGFQDSDGSFTARRRHLDALELAQTHLHQGRDQLQAYQAGELLAEELRLAQQALSEITGEFSSDDLLGRIFSSFCIGK